MINPAWAQAASGGHPPPAVMQFAPLVLIFAVFYFLLIRPQQRKQRKHQDMLKSLKVGDRVVTSGGLYGTIVQGGDHSVKLEIADRVRVEVGRPFIAARVEDGKEIVKEDK